MTDILANEDYWQRAQDAAQVWLRKAPENPWATIADEHEPYFMYWLERHQFPLWGYNVRWLIERELNPPPPTTPLVAHATTSALPSTIT